MSAAIALLVFWAGGTVIAGMTWLSSSRPRLFIRLCVRRDSWREAIRTFVRDPGYERGMRQMAVIQLACASASGIVGLWLWFA